MIMALWLRIAVLLAAMGSISPEGRDDREAIARAIASTDATDVEARWLVAIAWRESSFRAAAVGDAGASFCWAQIHMGATRTREGWTGADLAADPARCALVALRVLRSSLASCAALPEDDRIAAYASGSCRSPRGRRVSRDRAAVARRAFAGAP